jgi:hypothetical protein
LRGKQKPAALAERLASKSSNRHGRLDSEAASPSKPRNQNFSPAELRPESWPDAAGQSDYDYFAAHPNISSRIRLPFADEIAPELFEQSSRRAFIHVFIIRNSDGSPGTRARAVFYSEGGTA